jgi:hypothetical protein
LNKNKDTKNVRRYSIALENYSIKAIDYKTAMAVVIKEHYLHRKAPCSQAFGLFLNTELVGVICYGTPSSAPLRAGIAGKEHAKNVLELTRLWVCASVPKNGESFLIGNTLKLLNKEFVVSYADTAKGHLRIVYQATNWIYTGLSAKRTNWTVKGLDKHCQTIADKYTQAELRERYGSDFSLVPRSRKHRYIYINAKGPRRKFLLSLLRYKSQDYPK